MKFARWSECCCWSKLFPPGRCTGGKVLLEICFRPGTLYRWTCPVGLYWEFLCPRTTLENT